MITLKTCETYEHQKYVTFVYPENLFVLFGIGLAGNIFASARPLQDKRVR